MLLAVDANILVAELLRPRGRELIRRTDLELHVAEEAWAEARQHLPRRIDSMVARRRIGPADARALLEVAIETATDSVRLAPTNTYARHEETARARIPVDDRDWPTVALALALDADIWTLDHDYFGCGCTTWSTDALLTELTRPFMPQWSYAVVVISQVPDQPVWLITSEGDAPAGLPNHARSPWEVLPPMGKEGWEFVGMTRTNRVRTSGAHETLDLVFKKRA